MNLHKNTRLTCSIFNHLKVNLNFALVSFAILLLSNNCFAFFDYGEVVVIGSQRYVLKNKLGEGSVKFARKAFCSECTPQTIVISLVKDPIEHFELTQNILSLNDRLNQTDSIYIQKEIPMIKANIEGKAGEIVVYVSELGEGDLDKLGYNLMKANDFATIENFMDDAYRGVEALRVQGVVNTDIKANNMLIKKDKEGNLYLTLADHDFLYLRNHETQNSSPNIAELKIHSTSIFSPPEFFKGGTKITENSSLWQVAMSFYLTITDDYNIYFDAFASENEKNYLSSLKDEKIKDAYLVNYLNERLTEMSELNEKAVQMHEKLLNHVKEKLDAKIINIKSSTIADNIKSTQIQALENMKEKIIKGLSLNPDDRKPKDGILTLINRQTGIFKRSIEKDKLSEISIDENAKIRKSENQKIRGSKP